MLTVEFEAAAQNVSSNNPQKTLTGFYRPELDGMRFLAFLAVFVGHAFSSEADFYVSHGCPPLLGRIIVAVITSGRSGVPLFFLLSSYLITELLIREEKARGRIDVRSFYFRRALRIWPLYFVYILCNYLFVPASSQYALSWKYLLALLCFAGNLPIVFNQMHLKTGVSGHLWSVSVEEQFYLIWPWVLRAFGAARLLPLTLTLIVGATILRVVMTIAGLGFNSFWYNTLTWIDAIGAGALLTHLLKGRVFNLSPLLRLCMLATGPACWTLATFLLAHAPTWSPPVFYLLITGGSVLMLVGTLGGPFLRGRVVVYLGRISYGLYVYHFLGLVLAGLLLEEHSPAYIIAGLLFTIALASISYRYLELPFLRLKRRFTYVPSATEAALEEGKS